MVFSPCLHVRVLVSFLKTQRYGLSTSVASQAKEFGGRGVTVNAVCPGYIESDMTAELPNKEALLAAIPMKRFGTAEEVAGLVRFLATDPAAAYMTGHCYNIDGGLAIGAT
jgi:3-oxoacyl-[acyl-carrier protein] reductase